MSDLYNADPSQYGGFESIIGGSSSRGQFEQSQNLPFYQGRSLLSTIPEYQRNPLALERDLLIKLSEGRSNLMKILSADTMNGMSVNDVRFRVPIEQEPISRLYVEAGQIACSTTGKSTFKIVSNKTKIATSAPGGNPKQVGDIARLEVGQFVLIMFAWVEPRRTAAVSGSATVSYGKGPVQGALATAPVPEIGRVLSVDYQEGTCVLQRQWAGSQRSAFTYSTTTVPTMTVVDNATEAVYGISSAKINLKDAFIIPMAKSMKEDEIDTKVRNFSNTWQSGVLQRHAVGWGGSYLSEVIAGNLGLTSPAKKSRRQAVTDFLDHWEWTALFSEQSEAIDPETGYWSGTTDGLLAKIPKTHYVSIKGIDWSAGFTAGSSANLCTFHPLIFNKFLEGKSLIGSQHKVIVAGAGFYNSFATMINFMTQAVPDIKSEWGVVGKRFTTSDGLIVDVIPSDKMTLHGLRNSAILYDQAYFKTVRLNNYPSIDVIEINNENPLKSNGIIHGVRGYIDSYPDTHWMISIVEKTDDATLYGAMDPLGVYLG